MRFRIARGFWTSKLGVSLLGSAVLLLMAGAAAFDSYYVQYSHMIDARLSGQVFANTSRVYGAPRRLYVGEPLTPGELTATLERAGYLENEVAGTPGHFSVVGGAVYIRPSAKSYFGGSNAFRVEFAGNAISRLASLGESSTLTSAEIEPEPLTNLFDSSREKRRVVRMEDLDWDMRCIW